ncbi:DDE-type integrase/transposase/recombinase, partial [Aduncisulcus paluster]
MSSTFHDLLYSACFIYIDDIIVFGKDEDQFIDNLKKVLNRCKQVEYLGFLVDGEGKRVADERLAALRYMPTPKDKKGVRRLLGMLNYLRDFIQDYVQLTAPFSDLLKSPTNSITWTESEDHAWSKIVEQIEKKIVLYHFNPDLPLILRTDTSTHGIGGLLLMIKDGKEYPIMFFSKKFNETEKRWCTLEQEAYALFWCMKKGKKFLWGRKFRAETDHRNLTFLLRSESPKIQRWRMAVAEFDFSIHHIKGKYNYVADTLSRSSEMKKQAKSVKIRDSTANSWMEKIKTEQKTLSVKELQQLTLRDDIFLDMDGNIILPAGISDFKKEIIDFIHKHPLHGHYGPEYVTQRIQEMGIRWKSMRLDITKQIEACLACQKTKRLPAPGIQGHLCKERPFTELS